MDPFMLPNLEQQQQEHNNIAIAMAPPIIPSFKSIIQQPDSSYFNFNNFNSLITTTATTSIPFVSNMDSLSFPLDPFSPSLSLPFFNNNTDNNSNNNNNDSMQFDPGFDLGLDNGLHSAAPSLFPQGQMGFEFAELEAFTGHGVSTTVPFSNGTKAVEGEQAPPPTLFRKRRGTVEIAGLETVRRKGRKWEEMGLEEGSSSADVDVSGLNYESDEGNGGGDNKGKKKGLPAKNLMAERRRRKKLNDRLYMLRSVVPKISKMDRASILGDAIEYLNELLQRINDLHNELESNPSGSSTFHPLTPTAQTLPSRVKEELYPGALPSPKNQPAKVEVRVREGRAVNIHMFCTRRPGLLLSTMRALDNLGLDVQQAVISCFNGFALDVFKAEQCREGQDVLPEQIKAVLLDSAGFHHGMM